MITVGNCYEILSGMAGGSVDAIVTDPPYGLSFMGKEWDHSVPSAAVWREALRVLKPGGYLLAFAGTRTQHRMACNIEDAGFEIRDMLAWVYGSGFPKSLDVSKAIDKAAGAEREVVGYWKPAGTARPSKGGSHSCAKTTADCGYDPDTEALVPITAPATESAKKWSGWGTALKPALEPITMARKPLAGTVAANVLEHGTGAINVDACRVEGEPWKAHNATGLGSVKFFSIGETPVIEKVPHDAGRWPANVLHDGSEDVDAVLGEAKRFFYCPKASRKERGEGNNHPTIKPVELMRYLVRLVTPPGGLVLDPFCGSGTTGIACKLEGFAFHGIELNPDYAELATKRINVASV